MSITKLKEARKSKKNNDGNLANNYPPFDKVTRGDVIAGALGQDRMGGKRKKRTVKEGYSNWREDLYEVMDAVNKDQNEKQIKEKKINNKVEINPSIKESVENLGGTLLEFVETENVCILEDLKKLEILTLDDELLEEVVYEFFIESLEEGYTVDEIEFCILESIEDSLSYLTEEEDSKKRGVLSRIKRFVKGAAKKLARGVGYVAGAGVRAAKGTAREVASGYKRGRHGAEEKSEPDSSSSETSSTETKVRDGAKDGVRRGLRRTLSNLAAYASKKLDPDRGKPSAVHAKGPRTPKLRSGIGGGKKYEVAGRSKETESKEKKEGPQKPSEVHSKAGVRTAKPYSTAVRTAKVKTTPRLTGSSGESTSETKPSTPPSTPKRTGKPTTQTKTTKVTSSSKRTKKAKTTSANSDPTGGKLDDLLKSIRSEEYQLNEKSLSVSQQQAAGAALSAKRGEISPSELKGASLQMYNSMSEKQLRDFAKTKHKGLPEKKTRTEAVREELIARMQEKIAEQALEIQPKKQEKSQPEQKPQTSQIRSALTAIEKESQAEMLKSRALRRLAQSGGDVSSVTK